MSISRIYEWAQVQPTRPALIYNDVVIDYARFAKVIEDVRTFLELQALPVGTIAAVLVNHLADAWVAVLALRALGLTTIHVRSLAEAKALELRKLTCVITTVAEAPTHDLAGNIPDGIKIVVIPRLDQPGGRSGEVPLPSQSNYPPGGHILYTSGTTGHFKKVMWDGQHEDARSLARSRTYGFDKNAMVHNLAFGLWAGTGWKFGLPVWHAGGCLVLDQRPAKFRLFFRNKITFSNMTTAMFKSLVAEATDWTNCEIWVGGAATAAQLVDQAIARIGNHIHLHYTSTELMSHVLSSHVQDPDDVLWLKPAVDRTVQIVDELGHECAPGQEGDLRVLTTELDCQCYLDDEEATSKFFRDGFFYPGDRAIRQADGRIRVVGRIGDVLNVQGEKIPVGPIEQRFQQYLQVDEVCLFTELNDAGQEELVIAVQSDKEIPKQKLDSIRSEFKTFEKVRVAVLPNFPLSPTGLGKVNRIALRKLVFSKDESKV